VLRTLSQTGIVGTVLFVAFLVAAAWAIAPGLRRGTVFARGVVGIAATVFAYWSIHGSIDWFWEIPALGAPAFAFLGLAARTTERHPHPTPQPAPSSRRTAPYRLAIAGVVGIGLVSAGSVAMPWLSAREVDNAISTWRADPDGAYERLDRARLLNPLTDEPDVVESIIAASLGDERRQELALLAALDRNPLNWYPMVELAALETRRSDRATALMWLERAERLNPLEETIEFVNMRIYQGRKVSSTVLQNMYVRQARLLTGDRQSW
jgi:hypothetical protein